MQHDDIAIMLLQKVVVCGFCSTEGLAFSKYHSEKQKSTQVKVILGNDQQDVGQLAYATLE